MQDKELIVKAEELCDDSELQEITTSWYCKKFNCTPVIMEKVCASGTKCFHDIHYIFENEQGCPIPADACPINCVVCNFKIYGVGQEPASEGVSLPRRVGSCVIFTICYKVRVWYEFFDSRCNNLEVGVACNVFERELAIPLEEIDGGCVLCQPEAVDLCIRRLNLDCIRAVVVPKPDGFPTSFPPYAIEVTVEKEFFAMESGKSIICIPTCKDCIDLPFPIIPGQCIPFEREPKCDHYCQETDLDPGRCAQCPPPTSS